MTQVLVRPYQQLDKEQLISLILDIQTKEFGLPITIAEQPDLETIETFYQVNNGNFWVAEFENKIIGTIALIDIGNKQVALRKMFVASAFRGKEYNVGFELLSVLLKWCQEKRVSDIFLGTTAFFLAAHRFYEKNGFNKIAQESLPETFPRMQLDTIFYKATV